MKISSMFDAAVAIVIAAAHETGETAAIEIAA